MTSHTPVDALGDVSGDGGPPGPIVVARGLTKVYGDNRAVDGIDFEIARGESFGLLGPNGAGSRRRCG